MDNFYRTFIYIIHVQGECEPERLCSIYVSVVFRSVQNVGQLCFGAV